MKIKFIVILLLISIIIISCEDKIVDKPVTNSKPNIIKITSNHEIVTCDSIALFNCIYEDDNQNELFFSWSCDEGEFSDSDKPSTTWHAPKISGIKEIKCTIFDDQYEVSKKKYITVK